MVAVQGLDFMAHPLYIYVKYLEVIFDNRTTWRMLIEMIEAKAFRIFIRVYFLFKWE
jgi:hypothetical protein